MSQRTVTITIDSATGLTGVDIGKIILRCVNHGDSKYEITSTPDHIDIRFEKEYSDIAITGTLYERLSKEAKKRGIPIEKMLEAGAKRYGEPL